MNAHATYTPASDWIGADYRPRRKPAPVEAPPGFSQIMRDHQTNADTYGIKVHETKDGLLLTTRNPRLMATVESVIDPDGAAFALTTWFYDGRPAFEVREVASPFQNIASPARNYRTFH